MKHYSILTLVLLGALSLGCTKIPELVGDDETTVIPGDLVIPGSTGDPVTLTTTVSLGGKPESKALTAAGVKSFAVGDCLAVIYKNGSDETVKAVSSALEAGDIHDEGKTATITVTLTDPAMNGALRYIYPATMAKVTIATDATIDDDGTIDFTNLNDQDGTLATLASNYDLAVYDGNLTAEAALPVTAMLTNKLTIAEFNIKNDDGSQDITDAIVHLTVTTGTDEYRIHRLAEAGPIYVAMRPVDNANMTFAATDASNGYEKSVTDKTLVAGSMYPIDLKMAKSFDGKATPLTFEAKTAGAIVTFTKGSSVTLNGIEYNVYDEKGWQTYTYGTDITLTNVGDKVSFRGGNATYAVGSNNPSRYSTITCSADSYIYGNIMSLVSSTDYADAKTLATGDNDLAFCRLFYDNTHIVNHPSKALVLPATTLSNCCYQEMFWGCTGLTTAPALPATTLATYCYYYMFYNCTSLTTAPALPAEVLQPYCYSRMFYGCTSLTTAPELPATVLAGQCYENMFNGCKSLTTAPELPATVLAGQCYENMFNGCKSLTTAPALPAEVLTDHCYSQMFQGCTSLTTAPALPATTLADYCYFRMFKDCTSLTTAPALPATTLAPSCYSNMFLGCTSLTTAPVLPASTLVSDCYNKIFKDCTSLTSVTCLATEGININSSTMNWLKGVAATGTFTKNASTPTGSGTSGEYWPTDNFNGIPNGWTVIDYVAPNP